MPTQSVFEFILARPVLDGCVEHPRLVQLIWHAPLQGDRVVQVYVDGQLATVTRSPSERAVMVHVDRRRSRLIELLAVDPASEDVRRAYVASLAAHTELPRTAEVLVLRDERLPLATELHIAVDGEPRLRAPLWSCREGRGGLGGVLGAGPLGLDGVSCPGLGRGSLGLGHLGLDGEPWRAVLTDLPDGEHTVTITASLPSGDTIGSAVTRDITIAALAAQSPSVTIDADFTLAW